MLNKYEHKGAQARISARSTVFVARFSRYDDTGDDADQDDFNRDRYISIQSDDDTTKSIESINTVCDGDRGFRITNAHQVTRDTDTMVDVVKEVKEDEQNVVVTDANQNMNNVKIQQQQQQPEHEHEHECDLYSLNNNRCTVWSHMLILVFVTLVNVLLYACTPHNGANTMQSSSDATLSCGVSDADAGGGRHHHHHHHHHHSYSSAFALNRVMHMTRQLTTQLQQHHLQLKAFNRVYRLTRGHRRAIPLGAGAGGDAARIQDYASDAAGGVASLDPTNTTSWRRAPTMMQMQRNKLTILGVNILRWSSPSPAPSGPQHRMTLKDGGGVDPSKMITSSTRTRTAHDDSYKFAGGRGTFYFRFITSIHIHYVSLEHQHRGSGSTSSSCDATTAPHQFTVYGQSSADARVHHHLGTFKYMINESTGQQQHYFIINNDGGENVVNAYDKVQVNVESNHGHPHYTCVHRFRVYGRRPPAVLA